MRIAVLLLVLNSLLACTDDHYANGWDTNKFLPHRARSWHVTPACFWRDAGPFKSVEQGYLTDADLDAAIDSGYYRFFNLFPEFGFFTVRIHLTDDYVFWYLTQWAGGADEGDDVLLPIWTRGISYTDPGDQFIKRPPDANWTWWRYTARPLVPAMLHEFLHSRIGDPFHASPLWSRLSGPTVSGKAGAVATCADFLP